jgi:Tol biopolymer transport system component
MRHLSATMRAKTTLWMCVALAAGIAAAWLVVVLGTPTKRAEAAFPGNNGKIAFYSCRGRACDSEILTVKANGESESALTHNRAGDGVPTYSANGKKIAFDSNRSSIDDIFTMNANGTNQKRLTTSRRPDRFPSWSPDGNKIAFASLRHGTWDIYVINQDGSGLTRLTSSPVLDVDPAWSPDGNKIAFVRQGKIYVMKAARESATNRAQPLTSDSGRAIEGDDLDWSPNGNKIAFTSSQDPTFEGDTDISTIRADGSHQRRLTNADGHDAFPAWSPDGTKIAFSGIRGGGLDSDIFVMKASPESATNVPKRLTSNGATDVAPDWQPLP